MVASAWLWPLSSPLAGQKRPPILPGGRFLLFGGRERATPRPRVSSAASPVRVDDGLNFRPCQSHAGDERKHAERDSDELDAAFDQDLK